MNYCFKLRVLTVIALTIISLSTVEVSAQQNPRELFERARMLDESNQNLGEAIKLYGQVISLANEQRALAAKAQLRMGLLYDRLGRKAEAQRAYQAVVNQYADQTNEARQARGKIVTVAAPPRSTNASSKTTNGLTVRQVWAGFGSSAGSRAISPDGHHLVYVGSNGALYVRDFLTGENRRLTTVGSAWDMEETSGPTFSADGKLVAYLWENRGRADLRLIALDGSAPRILYRSDEGAWLRPFDWSSDGKQILALASGQSGTREIVLLSVADGSVHSLKALDRGTPQTMSLSPDGRYVVYDYPDRGDSSPERDIFILGTDGLHEARVVTQAAHDAFPFWTPDGRGVVFYSYRLGYTGAWFLRVVDGKPQAAPELLKESMGGNIPIGFTRNGSFYYSPRSRMREIYTATLDSTSGAIVGQPATITQRRVTGCCDWSPNGQYLAYLTWRPGEIPAWIIVVRSVATGEEYELAPDLRTFGVRGWSSDSRSLLVQGTDKEARRGFYRVDARTGAVSPLLYAKPGEGFSHARWFPNEKSIVYIGSDSGGERIVSRDLETGRETEIYRPVAPLLLGSCLEVSGGGQHLAFYLRDQKTRTMSVRVITGAGEKPRELGPRVKWPEVIDDILALTPDGRHVMFTTYDREEEQLKYKVWRIAVEGGGPQEIQLPMATLGDFGVASFHPDGKRIAFMTSEKHAVWVMENFLPTAQTKKTTASRR